MYNNFYKAKFVEELHFDFKNLPEINSSFDFNKTFSNYLFIKKNIYIYTQIHTNMYIYIFLISCMFT